MSIKNFFLSILKFCFHLFSLMVVGALSTFITLRFFTTGDEVVVPNLKGKSPVEAIKLLTDRGLQLKILPQKRFDKEIPADHIISQEPVADTHIKTGRSVEVYMSLGPEKVVVPDLTGQTTRVAMLTLDQYKLSSGKIVYVSSPGAESDVVLAQFPLPGTVVTDVRVVNILANSNLYVNPRSFVMPDVIGKPVSDVSSFFKDAGLRVSSSQPIDYPGISPGTVVKQSPPAGYKVSANTPISLYFSK
jgi:eukaryotic-like serine/threonine-protein kinase